MPENQVFTDEQIEEIISIFTQHMGHRQYIGARYVPIFGRVGEESIEWDNSAPYEPLTIVLHQGDSYTSRQYVPTGVDITNDAFWALTGNYNAQIEAYRAEVQGFDDRIADAEENASNAVQTAGNALEAVEEETQNRITAINALDDELSADIDNVNAHITALENVSLNTYEIPFARIVGRIESPVGNESVGEGCTKIEINGVEFFMMATELTKIAVFSGNTLVTTIDLSSYVSEINAITSHGNVAYITTLTRTNAILTFESINSYTVTMRELPVSANPAGLAVMGFSYYDEGIDAYVLATNDGKTVYFCTYDIATSTLTTIKQTSFDGLPTPTYQGCGYYAAEKLWYATFSGPDFALVWDEQLDMFTKYIFKNVYSYAVFDELEDIYFYDGDIGFSCKGVYALASVIGNGYTPTVFEYSRDAIQAPDITLARANIELYIDIDPNEDGYNTDNSTYGHIAIKYPQDAIAIAMEHPKARLRITLLADTSYCLIVPPQTNAAIDLGNHLCSGIYASNCQFSVVNVSGVAGDTSVWRLSQGGTPTFILAYDCSCIITGYWGIDNTTHHIAYASRCFVIARSSSTAAYFNLYLSVIVGTY